MVCFKCHFDFAKKNPKFLGDLSVFSDFFHNFTITQAGCSRFQCCERKWSILHSSIIPPWKLTRYQQQTYEFGVKTSYRKILDTTPHLRWKKTGTGFSYQNKMPPKYQGRDFTAWRFLTERNHGMPCRTHETGTDALQPSRCEQNPPPQVPKTSGSTSKLFIRCFAASSRIPSCTLLLPWRSSSLWWMFFGFGKMPIAAGVKSWSCRVYVSIHMFLSQHP